MRLRLLVVVLIVVLVGMLPAVPVVVAQGCPLYTPVLTSGYYYLPFATVHPGQEASPWWRTGNYSGYKIVLYDSLGGTGSMPSVDLHYTNASGVYSGVLHTFSTAGDVYTVPVATTSIAMNVTTPFTGYVCATLPPTPTLTPIPPTITLTPSSTAIPPTTTATVVLVTTTPVPPTTTPVVSSEQLLTTIRDTQDTHVKFFVFSAVVLIGVLVLSFVRIR